MQHTKPDFTKYIAALRTLGNRELFGEEQQLLLLNYIIVKFTYPVRNHNR